MRLIAGIKQTYSQVPERTDGSHPGRSAAEVVVRGRRGGPCPGGGLRLGVVRMCLDFYAGGMRGGGAAVLVTAAISGVATLGVALLPQLHFAYRQPPLHVALETAASLTPLLPGVLALGRARRAGRRNVRERAWALAVPALLNLV